MKSVATRRFWELFGTLPLDVQRLAVKNDHLWRECPNHPSLRFRLLQGSKSRFTVRIGNHYRALGPLESGTVTWVWIGSHSDYDQLLRSL
jgi:hypothetical protein